MRREQGRRGGKRKGGEGERGEGPSRKAELCEGFLFLLTDGEKKGKKLDPCKKKKGRGVRAAVCKDCTTTSRQGGGKRRRWRVSDAWRLAIFLAGEKKRGKGKKKRAGDESDQNAPRFPQKKGRGGRGGRHVAPATLKI